MEEAWVVARLDFMWRKKAGMTGIQATIRPMACSAMLYIVANHFWLAPGYLGEGSPFLSLLWWGGGKMQLTPRGILSEARLFGLCPLRDEVATRVVRDLTQAHC